MGSKATDERAARASRRLNHGTSPSVSLQDSIEDDPNDDLGNCRFRFSGHQTFPLRLSWLPKAIRLIVRGEDPLTNVDLGITELGLGKNMVEALRCWIEAFQLASYSNAGWMLTPIGKLVFTPNDGLDPYLEDHTTAWLLHWLIATNADRPFFAWECLFNRWNAPDFTRPQVLRLFAEESNMSEKPVSDVTLNQHLDVFVHSYCSRRSEYGEDHLDCVLAQLKLVSIVEEGAQGREGKRESHYAFDCSAKRSISRELFTFFLHDWWNRAAKGESTVSLAQVLTSPGSPGRVLKMSEREIYQRIAEMLKIKSSPFALIESSNLRQIKRIKEHDGYTDLKQSYKAPCYE